MTDLIQLIQEADVNAIDMEHAREGVETAKLALEAAKEKFEQARAQFDQTISRADEIGVPRAKIKKLVEERTGAFLASGLSGGGSSSNAERVKAAKPAKASRKSKNPDQAVEGSGDLYHEPVDISEGANEQAFTQ